MAAPSPSAEWLSSAEKAKAQFKPDYVKQQKHNGKDVIISIDVETTGPRLQENHMIALGLVVGVGAEWPGDGKSPPIIPAPKILSKHRWCFPIDPKNLPTAFEPRCAYEYWLPNPKAESKSKVEAQPQKEQLLLFEAESALKPPRQSAQEFIDVIKAAQTEYKTVYLVGDNLPFDYPFVHDMLHHSLHHSPLWLSTLDQRSYVGQIVSIHELAMKHRALVNKVRFNAHQPDKSKQTKRGGFKGFSWDGDAIDELVTRMTTATHDHMPENDAEVNYYRAFIGAYYDAPYESLHQQYPVKPST